MKATLRCAFLGLTALFIILSHGASAQASGCGSIQGSSISFDPGSCSVSPAAQSDLNRLAEQMRAEPACRVVIAGNAGGSKRNQQLSWERVTAVIEYMSETNNIVRSRFIFAYDGSAANDSVDFEGASADDSRPSNVAPPSPGGPACR